MDPFCCPPERLSWGVSQDPRLNLSKMELINFYPNQPLSQVLYFSEWVNITTSHLVIQTETQASFVTLVSPHLPEITKSS